MKIWMLYSVVLFQLEVFHGVLNNPSAVKDRCFFYMRDPVNKDDYTEAEYKVSGVSLN